MSTLETVFAPASPENVPVGLGQIEERTATKKKKGPKMHGHTANGQVSPTYHSFTAMRERCRNPKNRKYHLYGGRGISVCERWSKFENFLVDMGIRPAGTTLDRIDTNGNYEPGNCRWATPKQQGRNRNGTHLLKHNGISMTVTEWAEKVGVNPITLFGRIRNGWTTAAAIETPTKKRFLTVDGQTHPAKTWCKLTGIGYFTLLGRIHKGWDDARAVKTPVGPNAGRRAR